MFGLSAAEVPEPARVLKERIYQAFGLGGQFGIVNDGGKLIGSPVVAPHYSAMIAPLKPEAATKKWDWLIANGYFSPLKNVESLSFPAGASCDSKNIEWNQRKGSWNLALQAQGWGGILSSARARYRPCGKQPRRILF